jgi:very-short-patch-repair endonuclease
LSLNSKKRLSVIAKIFCRELRANSTSAEKKLWDAIRGKKFHNKKFYRQYPVYYDLKGIESFFIADFFCYEEKIVIEVDGRFHQYKLKYDKDRTKILNYLGLRVIRIENEEIIHNLEAVLKMIKKSFLY